MFVENPWGVIWRTHSYRAFIFAFLVLFAPEIVFALTGVEVDPYLRFQLLGVAVAYGLVGRVVKQDQERFPWVLGSALIIAAALVVVSVWGKGMPASAAPVVLIQSDPPVVVEAPQPPADPEASFLAYARPLVAKWEGLRETAYRDPVGVWTVCYGETKGVQQGDTYSAKECAAMLDRRLLEFRSKLRPYFTEITRQTRLPPTRDAAYGSFAYNVGVAGAGGSTAVKRLNAGHIRGGCEALTWWNKAGGRVLLGLVRRRQEEMQLCLLGLA